VYSVGRRHTLYILAGLAPLTTTQSNKPQGPVLDHLITICDSAEPSPIPSRYNRNLLQTVCYSIVLLSMYVACRTRTSVRGRSVHTHKETVRARRSLSFSWTRAPRKGHVMTHLSASSWKHFPSFDASNISCGGKGRGSLPMHTIDSKTYKPGPTITFSSHFFFCPQAQYNSHSHASSADMYPARPDSQPHSPSSSYS
jgi:hypothetical protein